MEDTVFQRIGLLLALLALFTLARTSRIQAATSAVYVTQSCSGSTAVGSFSWQGSDPGAQQQWLDLSLADNGFVPGTFISAGPLSGSTASYTWTGLQAGATHYVRVNQHLSSGDWDPSQAFMFTAASCGAGLAPVASGQPSQIQSGSLGLTLKSVTAPADYQGRKPPAGAQMLVVTLAPAVASPPVNDGQKAQILEDAKKSYVMGSDGVRVNWNSVGTNYVGSTLAEFEVSFTPSASAKGLRLYWPGATPIDLGR